MITLHLKGNPNQSKFWMLTLPARDESMLEGVMKLCKVDPANGGRCHIVGMKSKIGLDYTIGNTINLEQLRTLDKMMQSMSDITCAAGNLIMSWGVEQTTVEGNHPEVEKRLRKLETATKELPDIAWNQYKYYSDLKKDEAVLAADSPAHPEQDAAESGSPSMTMGM